MAAGEENIWWGNFEIIRGLEVRPRINISSTTAFRCSENVGNALFDIFLDAICNFSICRAFLHTWLSFCLCVGQHRAQIF